MKHTISTILLALLFLAVPTSSTWGEETETIDVYHSLQVDKRTRTYTVVIPPQYFKGKKIPVVLVFHGAGMTTDVMRNVTKWEDFARTYGFLAVYPQAALDRNWNDGRNALLHQSHREKVDDVAFIRALLVDIKKKYNLDETRIYATGMSNGAMFAFRLAVEMPEQFAAVAPVIGAMARNLLQHPRPRRSLPILFVHGTKDDLVPYQGGRVQAGVLTFGKILSVDEAVRYWVKVNRCEKKPQITDIPDRDPNDDSRVKKIVYSSKKGAEVVLYKVIGGGHTWPGGPQYFPESMIGKINRDMDTSEAIWKFFCRHSRSQPVAKESGEKQ